MSYSINSSALKIYVSVPARICYEDSRYKRVEEEIQQFKKMLDSIAVNYKLLWFDSTQDSWGQDWQRTVDRADLILHYLQHGESQFLGKGGYDILMEQDAPQYIMYTPLHSSTGNIRLYFINADGRTKNENDWQRYVKLNFGQRKPLKGALAIAMNSAYGKSEEYPFTPDQACKGKPDFVDSLMQIDIYE